MKELKTKQTFFDIILNSDRPATIDDLEGINVLNMDAFWRALHLRAQVPDDKFIITTKLIKFVNTLGKNKSGSDNAIGRLQFFLNAFSQELALYLANPNTLKFVGDDHYSLIRGSTGTNDPDFYFTTSSGRIVTLEAKMYFTEESYHSKKATTNFHKADYCLAYIIKSAKWMVSQKIDGYNVLYEIADLAKYYPWLLEINLPDELTTVQFSVPNTKLCDLTDQQLPEVVNYTFYTKRNTTYNKVVNL
jgi:hypothetical protein